MIFLYLCMQKPISIKNLRTIRTSICVKLTKMD